MGTALVRLSMPGGVGGQRRKPLPTRLKYSPPLSPVSTAEQSYK